MFRCSLGLQQFEASYRMFDSYTHARNNSEMNDKLPLELLNYNINQYSYHLLQNAGRGGHGSSKNMIGTRGADKVIYPFPDLYVCDFAAFYCLLIFHLIYTFK